MELKRNTFQRQGHHEVVTNSMTKANTEVIASVVTKLKYIGDKLSESYKLPIVNKAKFAAKTLSYVALENCLDILVVFLKTQS